MASQRMDQEWQKRPQRPPPPAAFASGEKGIDDWQKKIDEDFNQIYCNLYREYEQNPDAFRDLQPLMPPPVSGKNAAAVPQVVITDVKNHSKIEKIDHVSRTEQTFDDFVVPDVSDGGKIRQFFRGSNVLNESTN